MKNEPLLIENAAVGFESSFKGAARTISVQFILLVCANLPMQLVQEHFSSLFGNLVLQ